MRRRLVGAELGACGAVVSPCRKDLQIPLLQIPVSPCIPLIPARSSSVLRSFLSSHRTDRQTQQFLPDHPWCSLPCLHDDLCIGAHPWQGAMDQRSCVPDLPHGHAALQLQTSTAAQFPPAHHGAELLQARENGWFIITQFSAPCHQQLEMNFSDSIGRQPSTLLGISLLKWKKNNILSQDGAFGCCREHLEFIGKGKQWQWELLLLNFRCGICTRLLVNDTSPHCWIWSTKIYGPLPSLEIFSASSWF